MKLISYLGVTVVALLFSLGYAVEEECDANLENCKANDPSAKQAAAASTAGAVTYPLEHALSYEGDFIPRGELLVQVMKKSKKISIKFSSKTHQLSAAEVSELKKLVQEDKFYRIRIPSNPGSADSTKWLVASIRACQLVQNDFKETFRIHLDKSGTITSLELSTIKESRSCAENVKVPDTVVLKSKAVASIPKEAHLAPARGNEMSQKDLKGANLPPDVAAQLGSAAANEKKSEDGEKKEEESQSFIRKYWYIFMPLMMMSLFGGPAEEGGGQRAATQTQAGPKRK